MGNCFFHIFVVEDELAELRQAYIEREQAEKHAAALKKALDAGNATARRRGFPVSRACTVKFLAWFRAWHRRRELQVR